MCDAGYYRTQLDSLSDDCTGEGNLLFASFLTIRGFMVVTSLPTHTNTANHVHTFIISVLVSGSTHLHCSTTVFTANSGIWSLPVYTCVGLVSL